MKVNKVLLLLLILCFFILICCMCKSNSYFHEGITNVNGENGNGENGVEDDTDNVDTYGSGVDSVGADDSNVMKYDPNLEPSDSTSTDLSPSFNNTIGNSNNSSVYYPNQGISKSQIPKGKEDLYILKSEVVPPVCPVCPSLSVQQSMMDKKKCPPCPACARCPEPGYECKLVAAPSNNPSSFPKPILNDFSTFGA